MRDKKSGDLPRFFLCHNLAVHSILKNYPEITDTPYGNQKESAAGWQFPF